MPAIATNARHCKRQYERLLLSIMKLTKSNSKKINLQDCFEVESKPFDTLEQGLDLSAREFGSRIDFPGTNVVIKLK